MIRAESRAEAYQIAFTDGANAGVADLPAAKGGAGRGFGPHDLLEAAVATCLTMTARLYAEKHGLPLAAARCTVQLNRADPTAVVADYDLSLDGPLTDEQAAGLRAAVARCPVAKTLAGGVAMRATGTER